MRSGADAPWVSTSDLAALDDDGFLWIHGRTDDVIMRGGFKINAAKVADVLRSHPAVRECIVIGLNDERLGQVPVAAAELVEGATLSPAELEAYARANLTSYQVPTRYLIVDELPRTVSDKVRRPDIKAMFLA